jgi:peptide/nickel transport system substrate-binding protein
MKPGIELVMEANEAYWRKAPSVKRLVYFSVPEATTRLAMLKRGEVDLAYLLEGDLGESIKNDAELKLAFSGGIGTHHLDFFDMWDPKSPWADPRVRKAASLAIDRKALSDAQTLGASKPTGGVVLKGMEYALPIEPDPYDPEQAKKLLAAAGYPNGFDGGDLTPIPPYASPGEIVVNYLGAIGIRMKLRNMERAAFFSAFQGKKLKGVCFCTIAIYGNASTRIAENVPSNGSYAYGGWPDVDELYQKQLTETDPAKREDMLHRIQKILHERTRFAPIYDYFWASGVGPRVEEAALMKIDPFPWAAPLEDVKLKRPLGPLGQDERGSARGRSAQRRPHAVVFPPPSSRRRPGSTLQPLVPPTSGSRLSPGRRVGCSRRNALRFFRPTVSWSIGTSRGFRGRSSAIRRRGG